MPKLINSTANDTCFFCGKQANWVSVNAKIFRCLEKITQCPGFIKKAEESRKKNIPEAKRKEHLRNIGINGNKKLKELHKDKDWVDKKSKKISEAIVSRGGHAGVKNPMFSKNHKQSSKELQSEKAKNRSPKSYLNATLTKIDRGLATPKNLKSDFELYEEKVDNITRNSWIKFNSIINEDKVERGSDYELDHKYSKFEGFKNKISPDIIGHPMNLQLLPKFANRSKRHKCSITIEELILLIENFK